MAILNPYLEHWRWRNDDGSESAATWIEVKDVACTLPKDTNIRIRFAVYYGVTGGKTCGYRLQYKLNSGSWTNVTNSSSVVRASASSNITDNGDTTKQLTEQTSTYFTPNSQIEESDGLTTSITLPANRCLDIEYCVQVRSADVSGGDTVYLRMVDSVNTQVMQGGHSDASGTVEIGYSYITGTFSGSADFSGNGKSFGFVTGSFAGSASFSADGLSLGLLTGVFAGVGSFSVDGTAYKFTTGSFEGLSLFTLGGGRIPVSLASLGAFGFSPSDSQANVAIGVAG